MSPVSANNIVLVKLSELRPSPLNPRRHSHAQLTESELRPLAESLRTGGQWELITVRPLAGESGLYEIVNGERRFRAAKLAGIAALEARVQEMTDAQALDMMLTTGEQGEPLSPMALAHGYAERMEMEGLSMAQLAASLGVEKRVVHRHAALLALPEELQVAVDDGRLSVFTAYVVATLPGEKEREEFGRMVLHPVTQDQPLTRQAAERLRQAKFCRTLQEAPFDPCDEDLLAAAGPCTVCPWRVGNNAELSEELPANSPLKHSCMKPSCFEEKVQAFRLRAAEKLCAEEGLVALTAEENAAAFPVEGKGLSPRSDLVEWSKPVPDDLLKTEVKAEGVVRWEDICAEAKAQVQVRLGFNQQHEPVRLVRVAEALLAADEAEQAIFNEATRVRYGLEHQKAAPVPKKKEKSPAPQNPKLMALPPAEPEEAPEPEPTEAELNAQARIQALTFELTQVVRVLADVYREHGPDMKKKRRIEVEQVLSRHGVEV